MAMMTPRGIVLKSKSTDNSDDSNCKEAFPSTSPNTLPASRPASIRCARISDAEERAKECFPSTPRIWDASPLMREPLTPSRKRRTGSSSKGMTSAQIRKMTSLMHFVSTHRTERINILQIAMTPFKVCHRSQNALAFGTVCSVIICYICRPGHKVKKTPCVTLFTVN